jgi:uncharacterized protein YneF (UPF0154 family)
VSVGAGKLGVAVVGVKVGLRLTVGFGVGDVVGFFFAIETFHPNMKSNIRTSLHLVIIIIHSCYHEVLESNTFSINYNIRQCCPTIGSLTGVLMITYVANSLIRTTNWLGNR